jgi:membrane-bound metal-dependent hydrolase YbcI (DUF457 family)
MMHPTHQLIGLAATVPIADLLTNQAALIAAAALASTVGSALPDADHAQASVHHLTRFERQHPPLNLLGYVTRLPLKAVAMLPHRGPVTHGFPAIVWVLTAVAYSQATLNPAFMYAVIGAAAGYLAHLAADGATTSGLPGYPFTRKVWTTPRPLRVTTGSRGEGIYALVAVALIIADAANLAQELTR